MSSAAILRSQIEAALADRIPSALTPPAKTIREAVSTGIAAIVAARADCACSPMLNWQQSGMPAAMMSTAALFG